MSVLQKIVALEIADLEQGDAPAASILGRPAERVSDFGARLGVLVQDLVDTLFAHPVCIGLAAPQIGVGEAVAVINVERDPNIPTLVLVNPVVNSASGKKDSKRESCMSLPGYAGVVMRRSKVHVSYQDVSGRPTHGSFDGFLARVVQHEIDHLNGILYSHHTSFDDQTLEISDIFDYPDPYDQASDDG